MQKKISVAAFSVF